MNNRARRRSSAILRRGATPVERIQMAHLIGARRAGQSWFKAPAGERRLALTAARVADMYGVPRYMAESAAAELVPYPSPVEAQSAGYPHNLVPGTYEWAKAHAHESATAYVGLNLHRPTSSLNHRTARFCGKPYHWRQDYTGQLKLGSGESPW